MAIDETFFLEKSDSERSAKALSHFPDRSGLSTLPEEISLKLVKYAKKRLRKNLIDETYFKESESKVGWLRHDQLRLGSCLGNGSFSSVYEVKFIQSLDQRIIETNDVVVKILRQEVLKKPAVFAACAADLVKEGAIMASLNHENVMSVLAWTPAGLDGYQTGRTDGFYLVLDRLQATLSERIEEWIEESCKLRYAFKHRGQKKADFLKKRLDALSKLGNGISYLHSKRILHRDLKPDNIGFDRKGVLKVYDFDVSRLMPESSTVDETFLLTKKVGSFRYMSPECAKGEEYNLKADVYSFGLLCHEVITLEKPYEDVLPEEHNKMVFYKHYRPWIPSSWTQDMSSLLRCCWSEHIASRPTIEEACKLLEAEIPHTVAKKRERHSKILFFRCDEPTELKKHEGPRSLEETEFCIEGDMN